MKKYNPKENFNKRNNRIMPYAYRNGKPNIKLIEWYEDYTLDLEEQNKQLIADKAELEKNYYELLYAVQNKYPNETRHQTGEKNGGKKNEYKNFSS